MFSCILKWLNILIGFTVFCWALQFTSRWLASVSIWVGKGVKQNQLTQLAGEHGELKQLSPRSSFPTSQHVWPWFSFTVCKIKAWHHQGFCQPWMLEKRRLTLPSLCHRRQQNIWTSERGVNPDLETNSDNRQKCLPGEKSLTIFTTSCFYDTCI